MNTQMQQQMQMQQMQMQMQMQMHMGMNFGPPPMPPNPQQFMMEKNAFTNQDVLALAGLAPHGLDEELAGRPGPDPPPGARLGQRRSRTSWPGCGPP